MIAWHSLARPALASLAFSAIAAAGVAPADAQVFETRAAQALLIDAETETVLFQKDADAKFPPASLGKLMTSAVVFDAIRSGKLSLDTEFVVSETAWGQGGASSGGSTMFARLGSTIKVADLIKGIVIQSGNDACIIVAEGMAGTEAAFSVLMNEEARKIGLAASHFRNATGLDDPEQLTTARDLAKLAGYIIEEFPDLYKTYGEREFTWNKIRQHNRNPLLDMNIGADGLKTGFTESSGYGLVGSALRDGRRLIMVIAGTKSEKERAEEGRKLLDWGFRAFEQVELFPAGAVVGEARVFGGAVGSVSLVSKHPIEFLLPRGVENRVKGEIVYQGPVPAPIVAGQQIGVIRVTAGDSLSKEQPLYAAADVAVGPMSGRALDALEELLLGWW